MYMRACVQANTPVMCAVGKVAACNRVQESARRRLYSFVCLQPDYKQEGHR